MLDRELLYGYKVLSCVSVIVSIDISTTAQLEFRIRDPRSVLLHRRLKG